MNNKIEKLCVIAGVIAYALIITNHMKIGEHDQALRHHGWMSQETIDAKLDKLQKQVDNLRETLQGLVTLKASVLEVQVEQQEQKAVIDKLQETP